jgi:ethanolamine utilization protein EutA
MTEFTRREHTHSGSFAGLHTHDGGAPHWHDEFGEHMAEDLSEEEFAARQLDWRMHNATIVTVGIDVGSSTSHLMFSRLQVQILGEGASARSVVVGREVLWKSEIILTPYSDEETINTRALRSFIADAYTAVGATANEVDTGVIILTGEALKRKNARAIAEMAAAYTGKFVCAAAGHHLEAVLAANGSGTVARSRRDGQTLLNVDIGGGTTKFALVRDGEILATAAVAIGARQIVKDKWDRVVKADEPVRLLAERLGIRLEVGEPLDPRDEEKIVQTWIDILAGLIDGQPPEGLAVELMLTDPIVSEVTPQALTFSGGVSEFIFMRETRDFGDLGRPFAKALRAALTNGKITLPSIIDPELGIRATAIGASMFSSQVGNNIYVSNEAMLPLRGLPVLVPKIALDGDFDAAKVAASVHDAIVRADIEEGEQTVALAFKWPGELEQDRVRALAKGVRDGLPGTIAQQVPMVLIADQTIGHALGAALKEDLAVPGDVLSFEGVSVAEFDFIDVAEVIHPTEVVPVTIKSLLFAGGLDQKSIKQALLEAARAQHS